MTLPSLLRWSVGLPFTAWSLRQQLARKITALCLVEEECRRLRVENAKLRAAWAETDELESLWLAPSVERKR